MSGIDGVNLDENGKIKSFDLSLLVKVAKAMGDMEKRHCPMCGGELEGGAVAEWCKDKECGYALASG